MVCLFRILESRDIVSCIQNNNDHVTLAALFLIILHHYNLSFSLFICHCMLRCKKFLCTRTICHSHSY